MTSCKIFIPYGAVGLGCTEEAFEAGLALKPDIISSDAGSTDSGPYYLGTGTGKYAAAAVRRDLKRMILGAHKLGIPMTIGSAGTCGSDKGVDETADICIEICKENNIHAKIVKIYSQQKIEAMKKAYQKGLIKPLFGAPDINESTFDSCSNIVALCGVEPFQKALKEGADIVICGRATDTAVIAAYPLLKGCDPASCWHAAKIVECGGVCTEAGLQGGVFADIDDKGFTIKAVTPNSTVTPYSVSAHMLYENADPIHLNEPGISIDTSMSTYSQIDNTSVRVEGTTIKYVPYTMKLEGSGPVGFQTISIVGIRDRLIMKDPEAWINDVLQQGRDKLEAMGIPATSYNADIKPYGYNAVSGRPVRAGYIPNEIGMLLTVTADSQKKSTQIAKAFNPLLLHHSIFPKRQMPSFGFIFSPAEIEKGQIYEFKLYHTISISDPLELVRFCTLEV